MSEEIHTLVYDLDDIVYRAGFAGERRTIEATHKESGVMTEHKNRTALWGSKRKEDGGWLLETNLSRESAGLEPFSRDDFDIVDVQTAEPIANVIKTVNRMVEAPMEILGADKMIGYIGGKEKPLWRLERSTLWEYKGDRKETLSPLYKQQVIDHLCRKWKATMVNDGFEADDRVVMESYLRDGYAVVGRDKDSRGCHILTYNPTKPEEGLIDGRCFGDLRLDAKGNPVGEGRKFFYYQWAHGDSADHYKSNCFSETEWAEKKAYGALKDCRTDEECISVIKDIYQMLYPEPIEVEGWRGDKIVIDWLYVAREIFDMARMWRHENDRVDAKDVFKKFKML